MCAFGLGLLSLSSTFPWVWLVHVAQPSFVVTPQDKVVGVGRRVSLRCQVTGNPVPAVFWNKESSQVRCTVDSIYLNLTPNYALGNSGFCWTIFAWKRDTAVPAEGNGDLQTLICVLVARPRRCSTLSNPVPWQNWMAAYLGYTLRMKTLFRGWPVMVHDMHTRRRRVSGAYTGCHIKRDHFVAYNVYATRYWKFLAYLQYLKH